MRIPLTLILSAAALSLGCNESGTPDGTCLDCADTSDVGSDSDTDVGVDVSGPDVSDPPVVGGDLRCPETDPLEFTLRTVTLSGNLDLDGRNADVAFRPEWAQNAQIEATDVFTGRRFTGSVDLDGNYELELFASTYDLVVRFNERWCSGACSYVPLASGVDLLEDQTFDDRVEMVLHTVGLSLDDDAEVPSDDERVGRGYLDYIDVETNRVLRRPLNTVRPASGYSWIPKGRVYDLYWTTTQFRPQAPGEEPADLPVGSYLLGQVDTSEGGGERYQVDSLVIDAELTMGGESMPDDGILDGNGRGRLTINTVGGLGSLLLADIGETGPAVVSMRVFPGEHSAMFQPGQLDVQDALESWDTSAACGLGTDPCEWSESGPVQLDFVSLYRVDDGREPVDVSGTLEIVNEDGSPAEFGSECGGIQVVFLDAGTDDYAAVASSEGGSFETAMIEGPKDVWVLSAWDTECFLGGSLVAENVDVSSGQIELQATVVPFDMSLLVNGETMPDDGNLDDQSEGRGRVIFTPTGYEPGQTAEFQLGESGAAEWSGQILAGEYDVVLKSMKLVGRIGEHPLEQDVLPGTTRSLGPLVVNSASSVTYDLSVLHVTGSVSVDPADTALIEVPNGYTHGINLVSANDGSVTHLAQDETGVFEGLVYEDSYRIDYVGSGWAEYDLWVVAPLVPEGSPTGLWRLECGE